MPEPYEGHHLAGELRFAVIASRFNEEITSNLLRGAVDCLKTHGAPDGAVEVFRVPGAFELPVVARRLIDLGEFNAIVVIGALIRGDTPHFEFISSAVTTELARIASESRVPVAYGLITCNTMGQARDRSGPGGGNKGWEAALAAIEMANLIRLVGEREAKTIITE